MEAIVQRILVQSIEDSRLLDIAKECASIYNQAKQVFWEHMKIGEWFGAFKIQDWLSGKITRTYIGSDSYIASIQQFSKAVISWRACRAEYKLNPSKFSGEPKPPTKDKTICPIFFKKDNIRLRHGYLVLSLSKGVRPILIKWNIKLGKPVFVIISWKRNKG